MQAEPPSHPAPRRPRLVMVRGAAAERGGEPRQTIVHVLGTRPDAVKLAPVAAALERRGTFDQIVLHTGQHTEPAMTGAIAADLGMRAPDRRLDTGGGSHGIQTARALAACEAALLELQPMAVVVAGGSNSALAAALAAAKLGIPIARVEAGLRARDWSTPEEVNRVVADSVADTLFAPTAQAAENLAAEGAGAGRVHVVGSTAIDSLRRCERRARERAAWRRLGVERGRYVLVTLHRPANVDDDERLARIVEALATLARRVPVVFPMHPRTRERLRPMGDAHRLRAAGIHCLPPLGYVDFISLQGAAGAVVTDSGTVQEESSALGVSCFTLRSTTERTITLSHGTNVLLGDEPRDIAEVRPAAGAPTPCAIPLWDGHAGERAADALVANYALLRTAAGR